MSLQDVSDGTIKTRIRSPIELLLGELPSSRGSTGRSRKTTRGSLNTVPESLNSPDVPVPNGGGEPARDDPPMLFAGRRQHQVTQIRQPSKASMMSMSQSMHLPAGKVRLNF